jgi:hypothetical protein
MKHVWGRAVYTGICWAIPMERDHLRDPSIDGRIILRWISENFVVGHGVDRSD